MNTTKVLMCEACGSSSTMTRHFGLPALIDATAGFLPDLAREAFLNAQEASLVERDKHAKLLVKQCAREINMVRHTHTHKHKHASRYFDSPLTWRTHRTSQALLSVRSAT